MRSFAVKNSSNKYYSLSISGEIKWFDSMDMAYLFTEDDANMLVKFLETKGYSELQVKKYTPDWWKS